MDSLILFEPQFLLRSHLFIVICTGGYKPSVSPGVICRSNFLVMDVQLVVLKREREEK